MSNCHRWALTLGLAFVGGVSTAAAESKDTPPGEYARHGLIALGPAIVALKMTLDKGGQQ